MDNAAIIRRWFTEVWNNQNEAAIDELFAADGVAYGLDAAVDRVTGPAEFKPFWRRIVGAFPDIRMSVEDIISEGDRVALRWAAAATHSGDHLGVPPTNKQIALTGMVFARIADGKIAESWNNWDQHHMAAQLGL